MLGIGALYLKVWEVDLSILSHVYTWISAALVSLSEFDELLH